MFQEWLAADRQARTLAHQLLKLMGFDFPIAHGMAEDDPLRVGLLSSYAKSHVLRNFGKLRDTNRTCGNCS